MISSSIAFSGIDGAGKTTQINALKKLIGENHCIVQRLKFGYTPGIELLKNIYLFLFSIRRKQILKEHRLGKSRDPLRTTSKILFYLGLLDYCLTVIILWIFSILRNKVIIYDRHHCDNIFDIDAKYQSTKLTQAFRSCTQLLPAPTSLIILIIDPNLSKLRSSLKGDLYAEDKLILSKKYDYYTTIDFRKINAADSQDNVFREIVDQITSEVALELRVAITLNSSPWFLNKESSLDIVSEITSLYKLPFFKYYCNINVSFRALIQYLPELWFHQIKLKQMLLRIYVLTFIFFVLPMKTISGLLKTKPENCYITCLRYGRTSILLYTSDNKLITVNHLRQRNFQLEHELRAGLQHLPQTSILYHDAMLMVETAFVGIPMNRIRENRDLEQKLEKILHDNISFNAIRETVFISEVLALFDQVKKLEIQQDYRNILNSISGLMEEWSSDRTSKIMNLGVCHNDFHRGNILVDADNSLCVIDFEDIGNSLYTYDIIVERFEFRNTGGFVSYLCDSTHDVNDELYQVVWSELRFRLNEIKKADGMIDVNTIGILTSIKEFLSK